MLRIQSDAERQPLRYHAERGSDHTKAYRENNPQIDTHIPETYDRDTLARKLSQKRIE
jgi:hypothetical protein